MGNLKKIGIALIISILTQVTHASTLIYGPAAAKAFRGSEKGSYAVIFASYKVKQNALHHKGMLIKAHIPHVHIFIKNNIYSVVASPIHSAAVVREIGNKTLSKEVFHPSLLRTNRPMVVVLPHPQRTIFHLKQDELSRKQEVHLSSFKNIKGHAVVQFGGYLSYQGKQQFSAMDGLKGDIYTVSRHSDGNGLVGLAYLFTDPVINKVTLHYGINAFFLASTSVTGQVIQEKVYPNLSYHYPHESPHFKCS